MNVMSVTMDEHGACLKPLAMIVGPTATHDNVKEIRSWEHVDQLAGEFGADPHSIIWGEGTLDWCTAAWGEPPKGD